MSCFEYKLGEYKKWNYLVKEYRTKGEIKVDQVLDEDDLILMSLAFDKENVSCLDRKIIITQEAAEYFVSILDVPSPRKSGSWLRIHGWTLYVMS